MWVGMRREGRHGLQDGPSWDLEGCIRSVDRSSVEEEDIQSPFSRDQSDSMQGIRSVGGGAGDIGYELATPISPFLCSVIGILDAVLHSARGECESKSREEQDATTNGSC